MVIANLPDLELPLAVLVAVVAAVGLCRSVGECRRDRAVEVQRRLDFGRAPKEGL